MKFVFNLFQHERQVCEHNEHSDKGQGFKALCHTFLNEKKQMVQELILDPNDTENGRIPRTIGCELTEDFIFQQFRLVI